MANNTKMAIYVCMSAIIIIMYVCMYGVWNYACMYNVAICYVCMYVTICMYVCTLMHEWLYMYNIYLACIYMHVCMCIMYVCMHAYLYLSGLWTGVGRYT
jgi:hypothetical protein